MNSEYNNKLGELESVYHQSLTELTETVQLLRKTCECVDVKFSNSVPVKLSDSDHKPSYSIREPNSYSIENLPLSSDLRYFLIDNFNFFEQKLRHELQEGYENGHNIINEELFKKYESVNISFRGTLVNFTVKKDILFKYFQVDGEKEFLIYPTKIKLNNGVKTDDPDIIDEIKHRHERRGHKVRAIHKLINLNKILNEDLKAHARQDLSKIKHNP